MGNVHWGDMNSHPEGIDDEDVKEIVRYDFDDIEEASIYDTFSKKDVCPDCYMIHKGECL